MFKFAPRLTLFCGILLAFVCTPIPAHAAKKSKKPSQASSVAKARPKIESVKGKGLKAGGKRLAAGARVPFGTRLATDASTSARVILPDQSEILLGRDSEIVLEKPTSNGAEVTNLSRGQLRAIVIKKPSDQPHFYVRTQAAVMGVRGTEFDVDTGAAGEKTELHTLDGKVEVGKDQKTVESGKGVLVQANEMITAAASGLSLPQPFNRDQYLDQLKKLQPDLSGLAPAAAAAKAQETVDQAKAALPPTPTLPPVQPPKPPMQNPFGR